MEIGELEDIESSERDFYKTKLRNTMGTRMILLEIEYTRNTLIYL